MPRIDLSGLRGSVKRAYSRNAPRLKRTVLRASAGAAPSLDILVNNSVRSGRRLSARAGAYAASAASGAYELGRRVFDGFAEKRNLQRQSNEAIDELVFLTRHNLQLTPERIRQYHDAQELARDIHMYETAFGPMDADTKTLIRDNLNTFRDAHGEVRHSASRELMERRPGLYYSLAAGAKGLGVIMASQLIQSVTPNAIDRIIEVPEAYIAALAATTSLKQIKNHKLGVILATLVPTIGGMASYNDAVQLAGDTTSAVSSGFGKHLTNFLNNGKWLALGLIGKHSLDNAVELERVVDGRRVKIKPSEQYRSIDTGLNTVIVYGGTKLFSDSSLEYVFSMPQGLYVPIGHALAGVASYKYAVQSSRMPKPAQIVAKLAIPAVSVYFMAESIGDSIYQNSTNLQSFGKWLMEEGKLYSAAVSSAVTKLWGNRRLKYVAQLRR